MLFSAKIPEEMIAVFLFKWKEFLLQFNKITCYKKDRNILIAYFRRFFFFLLILIWSLFLMCAMCISAKKGH